MDFFSLMKVSTLRREARIFIGVLLFTLLIAGIVGAFYFSIISVTRDNAVQGAIALIAATLPLLIATVLIQFSDSSPKALSRRSDEILERLIPHRLSQLPSVTAEKATFDDKKLVLPASAQQARPVATVTVQHYRGDTAAYYTASWSGAGVRVSLSLRVELIVHRANVALFIPVSSLPDPGNSHLLAHIKDLWAHTLAGACAQNAGGAPEAAGASALGTYKFNRPIYGTDVIEGVECYALVGSVNLAPDLLWNPAAQFYFAEDLMYFVRAFVGEQRAFFQVNV